MKTNEQASPANPEPNTMKPIEQVTIADSEPTTMNTNEQGTHANPEPTTMNTNEQGTPANPEPNTASESGVEDSSAPGQSDTAEKTRKPAARLKGSTQTAATVADESQLDAVERGELKRCEESIKESRNTGSLLFSRSAMALAAIRGKKLYRGKHGSFEAYCKDKWGFSRAHGNRLADAGEIIERQAKVSPRGDIISLLNSDAHYRPLAKLEPEQQDAVIALLAEWLPWNHPREISPLMVRAAVLFLHPPTGPKVAGTREKRLITKFKADIDCELKELPENADKLTKDVLCRLRQKTAAPENPARTTGIDWTDATWNPLQGCCRKSAGCDRCYAAQLCATRLADVYPGLARKVIKNGKTTFMFNNVIRLLPEQLGDPLSDLTPRRYFVNSMSDLFHDKVPEDFITAVFDVMVKAHWHQFQVLTKRPERMAEFTAKYFAGKQPPANIWLGASAENQKALEERLPHLLKVKTAVRWLSCEPLIGPIEFDSLDGIHWIVAGGESGNDARKMELPWATSIRDACQKAGVAFFFKQWGLYGEDGTKLKKVKKDRLTPPPLEGKIHDAYPQARGAASRTIEPKRNTQN